MCQGLRLYDDDEFKVKSAAADDINDNKKNAVGWGWGVEGAYVGADYVDDSDSAADDTGAGEDAAKSVIFQCNLLSQTDGFIFRLLQT